MRIKSCLPKLFSGVTIYWSLVLHILHTQYVYVLKSDTHTSLAGHIVMLLFDGVQKILMSLSFFHFSVYVTGFGIIFPPLENFSEQNIE